MFDEEVMRAMIRSSRNIVRLYEQVTSHVLQQTDKQLFVDKAVAIVVEPVAQLAYRNDPIAVAPGALGQIG